VSAAKHSVAAITDSACKAVAAGERLRRVLPHHDHPSTTQLLNLCFDFRESRLLQLLIQRGKIGFE
jgi:hypothetical protein